MTKILCIDDEALIREDIVEELQDAGYETVEAECGKSGLAAIKESSPNLVLCDITMPGMDGYQVLAELRENCPEFADLPFVFLSALADVNAIRQGKLSGADDYLTKPIDFELMIATVKARLRQVERMEKHKQQQFFKLYDKISTAEDKKGANGGAPAAQNAASPSSAVNASASESEDVVGNVMTKLKVAVEQADASATVAKNEIFENARVECRSVLAIKKDLPLQIAEFDANVSARISSLISTSSDPEELTAEFDMLTLGQAAVLIYQGVLTGETRLVVPVNYTTLQNKRCLKNYQSLCNELAGNVRKSLVLGLVNIPLDTMSSKVSDTVKYLRMYSPTQMVRIGNPVLGFLDLNESGVAFVAIDHSELAKSMQKGDKQADKLVQHVHHNTVKILVDNVPNEQSAQKMWDLGVDYVALT